MTTPLLRVSDVATRCQVTGLTVRRWIDAGELPAYKVGREWRIDPASVDAFLAARRTAADVVDTTPAPVTRAGGHRSELGAMNAGHVLVVLGLLLGTLASLPLLYLWAAIEGVTA